MIIFLGFCSISRIRVGNHHLIDYRGWTWRDLYGQNNISLILTNQHLVDLYLINSSLISILSTPR
ncbi:unnamed protein product [Arabidopsis thaliana]|uniref:Uncharacterized protein n=2 Tax=Arabidopsis thaliana TaxID=3702 RepID=A0A654EBB7_ARATH|nr:uncharacterized protein AT1G19394 [Arabidopsis thaliana]AEE29844.1 hypothetical protein AT1G19394 [Arabidopsis thaliana]VYS46576.1 unnamed protein product [Arabidopsis thaliana]|eukprot:NP_001185034.1 hypothetical protein AT1G19394 [Arabidopsis thaliana]